MGRRAPRSIGEALGRVRADLEPPSLLAAVQAIWAETVGAQISAVAHPVSERRGVITVHCADTVWAEELNMMREELLSRLQQRLTGPHPADLKFRYGRLES